MISGMKTREHRPPSRTRTTLARLVAAAGLWAGLAGSAWALDLDELMGLLAQVRSGQARFTEQRHVKGLDAPLTSSGLLSFAAPDRFTRQTLQPRAESMSVEGNTVTLSRSGRSRSLALDAAPEIEAIVEAIRGTLTGNGGSLRQHFKPTVAGDAAGWTLELVPIEPRLAALLAQVRIAGKRAELRSVEMRMADGDRSVMAIEPLPPGANPAPAATGLAPAAASADPR